MNNAMLHIGLGFVAAGAGVLFGRTLTPCAPCFPSTVDLGEVRLFEPTRVAIPLVNPSAGSVLRVENISTSCGCADPIETSFDIAPGSSKAITISVRATPPQHVIDFIVRMSAGGAHHSIRVSGVLVHPFPGYPARAEAAITPAGRVINVPPGSGGFIARAEVFSPGVDSGHLCLWDHETSRIVLPAQLDEPGCTLVIWDRDDRIPVWSGPVVDADASMLKGNVAP